MIPHPPPRELLNHDVVEVGRNHRAAAVLADEGGATVGKVGYAERGGWGGGGGHDQPSFRFSVARRSRIHFAPSSSCSMPKWAQKRDTSARSARVIDAMNRTLSSGFFGLSFALVGRAMMGECTATMSAILDRDDIGVQLKTTNYFIIPLYTNVTDDTSVISQGDDMSVQTCKWEPTKQVSVTPDLAGRWFGMTEADIEQQCGRFTKGKHKGELRGWIVYRKVREGGWCYPLNCVLRPGMMWAHFCKTYDEAGQTANLPTDRYFPATRVDTCYGFNPVTERAETAARVAAIGEQMADAPRTQRREEYNTSLEMLRENSADPIVYRVFNNAVDAYIEGGWPAVTQYHAESLVLSARAAGAVA